jgi:hypothetical protein
MFDTIDFYPTPRALIDEMLTGIDYDKLGAVLEPSAGKGNIIDALKEKARIHSYRCRENDIDLDAVEFSEDLQHVLRGKGVRVVHDDFLTYHTYKRYSLIVMNPPFSTGDKHLLKALDMMSAGGRVVCLLNAETLQNPYTNTRKDLARRLVDLKASVQFIRNAFLGAEVKSDVEVALVKVDIPGEEPESDLLAGLRQSETYAEEEPAGPARAMVHGEFMQQIVQQYNFEVRAGVKLIREYQAMRPLFRPTFKSDRYNADGCMLSLKIGDKDRGDLVNTFVRQVRSKYWEALFSSDEFRSLLTTNLLDQFMKKINELTEYDFSLYNIMQIRMEISRMMCKSVEDTILALFDELSHKHSWYDETSNNIHYYNGWKTNQAWKINKKVIIPLHAIDTSWSSRLRFEYRAKDKLADIEKVLNYLDDGRAESRVIMKVLDAAENNGQTKKIPLKHFDVTFYKKGTCHIEFRDMDLLKKFNLFGSQKKGWLPPCYGKVKYADMKPEERAVVDDYEGEFEYKRVLSNRDYFIYQPEKVLMLKAK